MDLQMFRGRLSLSLSLSLCALFLSCMAAWVYLETQQTHGQETVATAPCCEVLERQTNNGIVSLMIDMRGKKRRAS